MSETASTESSRSRWVTRISFALAAIAALVVLAFIGFVITVYVVTEKYDSLHDAVKKNDILAVRCFLMRFADVNAKDEDGRMPLHVAASRGHTEIAELLIARGADINAAYELPTAALQGSSSMGLMFLPCGTPLHMAAEQGHTEIAGLLIAKGADVNATDKWGKTPLAIAVEIGHKDVVDLLRKHGASK